MPFQLTRSEDFRSRRSVLSFQVSAVKNESRQLRGKMPDKLTSRILSHAFGASVGIQLIEFVGELFRLLLGSENRSFEREFVLHEIHPNRRDASMPHSPSLTRRDFIDRDFRARVVPNLSIGLALTVAVRKSAQRRRPGA